jgi:orotate phosphoribosyltransferase
MTRSVGVKGDVESVESTFQGLLSAVSRVDVDDGGGLVEAARLGSAIEEELEDPDRLRALATLVSRAALAAGCVAHKGASTAGNYLAAAAVAANDGLRIVTNGPPPERVLVIDHLLVTGFSIGRAAEALRAAGASDVFAWVVAAVPNAEVPRGVEAVTTSSGEGRS